MANEKKVSVKKAWDYNLRAWKIYAKMRPKLFVSYICEAVLAAAVPYAGIWLSARFVDELAGRRDAAMLWKLAGTLLLTELVLGICLFKALEGILQGRTVLSGYENLCGKISEAGFPGYG